VAIKILVTGELTVKRMVVVLGILVLLPTLVSAQSTSQPKETISFAGKITKINRGKDGSTVELTNETTGEKLYATISIPNLGPNIVFDFSDIKLGRKLEVMGKPFLLGEDRHITAIQAKQIE
jgi:hypothetical protein